MILPRQRVFSDKKDQKKSLYKRYNSWFDKQVDERRKKDRKRIKNMKDGSMKDLYTDLMDPEKNRLYYMTESERKQKNFSDKDILNSIPKKSRGKGKSKVYKDSDAEEYWPYERYCVQFDDQPGIHDVHIDKKTGKISYKGYNK